VINNSSSGNVERAGYKAFSMLPRQLAFEGVKLETRQSMNTAQKLGRHLYDLTK